MEKLNVGLAKKTLKNFSKPIPLYMRQLEQILEKVEKKNRQTLKTFHKVKKLSASPLDKQFKVIVEAGRIWMRVLGKLPKILIVIFPKRDFVTLRLEEWPAEPVAMMKYFEGLAVALAEEEEGIAMGFILMGEGLFWKTESGKQVKLNADNVRTMIIIGKDLEGKEKSYAEDFITLEDGIVRAQKNEHYSEVNERNWIKIKASPLYPLWKAYYTTVL